MKSQQEFRNLRTARALVEAYIDCRRTKAQYAQRAGF